LPLETATFISDLLPSNPAHTDGLNQADAHMRLTKAALKNTFPNFTSAVLHATQAQLDAAVAATQGGTQLPILSGSVASPAIYVLGSATTGIYSPGVNQVGITNNGIATVVFGAGNNTTFFGGVAAAALASTGAYSGGTGQLVPIGHTGIWWDDVLPAEGGYAWANGQAISRIANPILWARWGTRYGAGDNVNTFNLPDLRDTVPVGKSTMGSIASRGLQTFTNTTLNALIGAANVVLGIANLPPIHSVNATQAISVQSTRFLVGTAASSVLIDFNPANATGFRAPNNTANIAQETSSGANAIGVDSAGTMNTAVSLMQPSTTCNYIIRVG
jgi:microcystin-dependent protein